MFRLFQRFLMLFHLIILMASVVSTCITRDYLPVTILSVGPTFIQVLLYSQLISHALMFLTFCLVMHYSWFTITLSTEHFKLSCSYCSCTSTRDFHTKPITCSLDGNNTKPVKGASSITNSILDLECGSWKSLSVSRRFLEFPELQGNFWAFEFLSLGFYRKLFQVN